MMSRLAPFLRRATVAIAVAAALAGGVALAQTASAQTAPAQTAAPTPAAAASAPVRSVVPLASLLADNEPLTLCGMMAERSLFFPVSPRAEICGLVLRLEATSSIALQGDRSQLAIQLAGRTVAQLPLKGSQPSIAAEIDLPADLVRTGFNRLSFVAAQHSLPQCEDPNAPELWTQIDTRKSTLAIASGVRVGGFRLSELDALAGPGNAAPFRFTILTAGERAADPQLRAGALVVQAIAVRLGYVPLHVRHAPLRPAASAGEGLFGGLDQYGLAGADAAIVGTRAEIAPFLSPAFAATIAGAFLGIVPLDSDPSRFVLVVSGSTAAEVERAATALTLMDFPFTDAATARIEAIDRAALGPFAGLPVIEPDRTYGFADLGFRTRNIRGAADHNVALRLYVPEPLYFPENAQVELMLDFAYGAGLGRHSALNLHVNGQFQAVIPLGDPTGGVLRGYRLQVPARALQPGFNVLRFEPVLASLQGGNCEFAQNQNLLFSLADTSSIRIPPASRYARQPDLQVLARTGFPFSRRDGAEAGFVVPSADSNSVGAMWTLAGRLAQTHRTALVGATYTSELRRAEGHQIIVGAPAAIDPELLGAASLALGAVHRVPYPSLRAAANGASGAVPGGRITQASDLGDNHLVVAFQSPRAAGHVSALVTAASPTKLREGIERLVAPDYWDQMQGDVFLWRDDPARVAATAAAASFHIGRIDAVELGRYWFSRQPWLWISGILLLLIALGWLSAIWLRRYGRRRHRSAG